MPQLPQLFESLDVSTHWEPHAVCDGEEQVMLPPVPPPPLRPPVPGLLPDGLLQAVAKRARQKPKIETLRVFMSPLQFPARADVISYTEMCVATSQRFQIVRGGQMPGLPVPVPVPTRGGRPPE